MLQVNNVSKSYGIEIVLADVSFVLNRGERAGLVGPNGGGKSTLLRIITGLEPPDSGDIRFDPPGLKFGYLAQSLVFEAGETVAEALARATAEHSRAWAEMQRLADRMAAAGDSRQLAALTAAYGEAEARFEASGGYGLEARLEVVLAGLGLSETARDLPVELLGGLWKRRLALAGLLSWLLIPLSAFRFLGKLLSRDWPVILAGPGLLFLRAWALGLGFAAGLWSCYSTPNKMFNRSSTQPPPESLG